MFFFYWKQTDEATWLAIDLFWLPGKINYGNVSDIYECCRYVNEYVGKTGVTKFNEDGREAKIKQGPLEKTWSNFESISNRMKKGYGKKYKKE